MHFLLIIMPPVQIWLQKCLHLDEHFKFSCYQTLNLIWKKLVPHLVSLSYQILVHFENLLNHEHIWQKCDMNTKTDLYTAYNTQTINLQIKSSATHNTKVESITIHQKDTHLFSYLPLFCRQLLLPTTISGKLILVILPSKNPSSLMFHFFPQRFKATFASNSSLAPHQWSNQEYFYSSPCLGRYVRPLQG